MDFDERDLVDWAAGAGFAALGARRIITTTPVEEEGRLGPVLTGPDGNEFCVLPPPV